MSIPPPPATLPFTPVPLRARRDGWTPETQVAFIAALAATRCVVAAARAVGRSFQTVYRLRARAGAEGFVAAWDAVFAPPLPGTVFEGRAVDGVARPIRWRGRQVGERRRYDNRLALYLLRLRRPDRYGAVPTDYGPYEDDSFDDVVRGSSPSAHVGATSLAPSDLLDDAREAQRGLAVRGHQPLDEHQASRGARHASPRFHERTRTRRTEEVAR